jgi:hypothetical protein
MKSRARASSPAWRLAVVLALGATGCARDPAPTATEALEPDLSAVPRVVRLEDNPIVVPEMLPGQDGENINGPSLVRAPSWIEAPLGRYYLYFSHHAGDSIRLAYANDLAGPWTVHEPGTLHLEQTICNDITESSYADYRHVASPDVHVDEEARRVRMYFHCPVYVSGTKADDDSYRQVTLLATSRDGIDFEAGTEPLGNSYFRVFPWDGRVYALGMPGVFYRSEDGLGDFEEGPTLFTPDMRHSAVTVRDGRLGVFYTVVGENPERILYTEIELTPDWMSWTTHEPVVVLEPERSWEGADLPAEPSVRGFAMEPVRQLRDPALFEEDGQTYLLYAVAGESGIAIARLEWS